MLPVGCAFVLCLLFGMSTGQLATWSNISTKSQMVRDREAEFASSTHVKGVVIQVSGTDHLVVGVSPLNHMLYLNNQTQEWETLGTGKITVKWLTSCADGTVWFLDTTVGKPFRQHLVKKPTEVPGIPGKTLFQIAGKDANECGAVTTEGQVYRYKESKGWWPVLGNITAKQLAMGSDGAILALDEQGRVMESVGDDWVEMMGGMTAVTLDVYNRAGNRIAITDSDFNVYVYVDDLWLKMDSPVGGCVQVSISLNEVFCVTSDNNVFRINA
ncbi:hypothetical protein BV898_08585 [Hypsibius exemplaris]|uniref:Uncharacterized protein n=1 Tax=Hypsibius exemplaris TaxID=2072580 RepID=A0A1W0WQ57_HYPEX|nr:hypothetical protein BV898_08585 [Hypsibius exemplaris]